LLTYVGSACFNKVYNSHDVEGVLISDLKIIYDTFEHKIIISGHVRMERKMNEDFSCWKDKQ